MEFINVSSLISDFWNLFFYPLFRVGLMLLLMRFIMGKETFNSLKKKVATKIIQTSQKVKYKERLGKATPVVTAFLFFSVLYLVSLFYSSIESFFPLDVSFGKNSHLTSDMVLNVWKYHPYIEDFGTLQRVVYYNAQESGIGSYMLLSSAGLRNLPEMLLRSLVIFAIILLVLLVVLFFV